LQNSRTVSTYCPSVANLESWTNLHWEAGVQVEGLDPLETLEVQTKNTTYEITVIDARKGEILVRGGRFFPVCARARLAGASLAGSFLKVGGIYVGFCMEIHTEQGPIVTTRVRHVAMVGNSVLPS
jgi:hypothetical protein